MHKQDARFRGFMGRLSDARFAWKFYGLNVVLGLCLTALTLYRFSSLSPSPSLRSSLCSDPASTPKIQWAEYVTHSCSTDDLWLLIDGFVYDLQSFRSRHPGSESICGGAGEDASDIFRKIHPSYVRTDVLPQFCIGSIVR
eukprot:TRINITY_DN2762_c0_g1_i1.p1 TRINITY_DN2762_c0_g1~~TRINITY_DN2762_c0_g1_i1.p1  ORF type:complete len:154 (+),score=48.23 TRINITY_DN2762_c0_g1_i1:41-463(+)